jgi:uncharacterized protein YjbI with pentapeptide repeats
MDVITDQKAAKHTPPEVAMASRSLAAVTFVCLYCLAVVSTVNDASIVFEREVTVIPFINARVTSVLFFWAMPAVVLLSYHYFQHQLFQLATSRTRRDFRSLPTESFEPDALFADLLAVQVHQRFTLRNYAATTVSYLVVWLLPLVTLAVAWWRSLVKHDMALSVYGAVVLSLALGVSIGLLSKLHGGSSRVTRLGSATVIAAFALMLFISYDLIEIGSPVGCFEGEHDQNHPLYDRNYPGFADDCDRLGSRITRLALRSMTRRGMALGADLTSVDLTKSDKTTGADRLVMRGIDLRNARGAGFHTVSGTFTDARLAGASFSESELIDSNFKYATLFMTDMRVATLHGASFIRSTMKYVDFDNAQLNHSFFRGAIIEHGNFTSADLTDAALECATFIDSDFRDAIMSVKTDLTNTRFLHSRNLPKSIPPPELEQACGSSDTVDDARSHNLSLRTCPAERDWNRLCEQTVHVDGR